MPVYGKGINDVKSKRNCPFYAKWIGMLERCYSSACHDRFPTYKDCSVCTEWLLFSNFKSWMKTQDFKGNVLDKDILVQGNKVYSPESCIFVSSKINSLLLNKKASRGQHPQGVSFDKGTGKYRVQCNVNGKYNYLGAFKTAELASNIYKAFKYEAILLIANQQQEPLKSALINYNIEN